MAMQLRTRGGTLQNPRLVQLFSSSSSSLDSTGGEDKKESSSSTSSSSSFSSYFSDVKASLKQTPPPPRRVSPPPAREFPSFSSVKPSNDSSSFDEIRKNLSEFRRRSSVPPPDHKSSQTISFQELYKRNVIEKSDQGNSGGPQGNTKRENSFESIRESLKQLRSSTAAQSQNVRLRGGQDNRGNNKMLDPYSLKSFKDSLKMRPAGSESGGHQSMVLGGSEVLPSSVFGKELRPKSESESQAMKTEFVKMYTYGELGEKLMKLRPSDNKKGFSLEELNDRLRKLREMEEKEMDSKLGGVSFKELRESLVKLRVATDDKTKKSTIHRLDLLGHIGGTPSFMMHPPKEQLVEKYFHPDNMSSEEKLKLQLQKVRDEFKLSESDCGSSRVQVAQLTTKIKHLSSVLHKKDKHSRKGLQAMVQRRKKLLKYLRRTDWDSYCLVLSKLGLRDNPDYKN